MASHHSEKAEFLRQMQREKPTFVIGNSNQPSHATATLTCPLKGLVRSPPLGTISVNMKGVAKLLDRLNVYKASGTHGLDVRALKE